MFSREIGSATSSMQKQQGIATVLVVVLIGVALIATSFGVMHSIRSTQEQNVAAHATTHAQNGVWAGVEAFRLYLQTLDQDALVALNDAAGAVYNVNLTDAGAVAQDAYGSISVGDVEVTGPVGGSFQVSATITNIHAQAKASSSVSVVFQTEGGGPSDSTNLPATLNFYDDLNVVGNINFKGPSSEDRLDINVDGEVDLSNLNLSAIGKLSSTKSVKLENGPMDIELIHSNENVEVKSASQVIGEVQARGNILTTGNSTVTIMKANGYIDARASGYSSHMDALGNIGVSGGSHGTVTAGGAVNWTSGGNFTALNSVGDILINSAGTGGTIKGQGDIDCTSSSWTFSSISVNGTANNCGGEPPLPSLGTGANESIGLMSPVAEVVMNPFIVDVHKLQGHANWIFSYDAENSRMLVRTQNINGVADGTYMVGSRLIYYPVVSSNFAHLCEIPESGNACETLATPETAVCLNTTNSECFFYESSSKQWRIDGTSAAPGIMWFEGNVNMNNGTNYTTILASGNINTGGNFSGYAINYAGYEKVCNADAPHLTDAGDRAKYIALFGDRYPLNLCDKDEGKLIEIGVGNIALAAGGYEPPSTTYTGGDIALGSTNKVHGTVLAGNAFTTVFGDTHVFGAVVAANLADNGNSNILNGSTYVDLESPPSTYDPTTVPNMTDTGGGGGGGGGAPVVNLLWSRYL